MRTKQIETVMLPVSMGRMVERRMAPLVSHYWNGHGRVSLDDLVRSAYLQGIADCAQLDIPRQKVAMTKKKATWAVY